MERYRRARGGGRGGCGARATLWVGAAAVGFLVLSQVTLSPQLWGGRAARRGVVRAGGSSSVNTDKIASGGESTEIEVSAREEYAAGLGGSQGLASSSGAGGAAEAGEGVASGIGQGGCINGGESEEGGGCRCPDLFEGQRCEVDLLQLHADELVMGLDLSFPGALFLSKDDLRGSVVDLAGAGDGGYFVNKPLREALPGRVKRERYASCALVGSSGSLLNYNLGPEIDSHEAIFRFNNAPVKGFEKYVGSKTTFQVLNSKAVREYLAKLKKSAPKSPWDVLTISDFQGGKKSIEYNGKKMTALDQAKQAHWAEILQHLRKYGSTQTFSIVSPALSHHVKELYDQFQSRFETQGLGKHDGLKPSSGFYTFFLMREMCDSISIYGVSSREHRRDKIKGAVKYNYYNNYKGAKDGRHSFPLMALVFRLFGLSEKVSLNGG